MAGKPAARPTRENSPNACRSAGLQFTVRAASWSPPAPSSSRTRSSNHRSRASSGSPSMITRMRWGSSSSNGPWSLLWHTNGEKDFGLRAISPSRKQRAPRARVRRKRGNVQGASGHCRRTCLIAGAASRVPMGQRERMAARLYPSLSGRVLAKKLASLSNWTTTGRTRN
jgi:hypothetical protein